MKMAPGFLWIIFDVNLFRILIAAAIILFGIRILMGKNLSFEKTKKEKDTIFSERNFKETPKNNANYNVMFGKSVYDFTSADSMMSETVKVKIDVVFGAAVIKISKNMPVRVKSEAAFGGSRMPDGNTVAFGSITYNTDSFKQDLPYLLIESNVVFGGIEAFAE
jgi:hypothetical protein